MVSLSEELPKQDAAFTAVVAKIVDTLRNLLNNDPSKLSQHILVNEEDIDGYLLQDWRWNDGRYGVQRGLREMVDVLVKVRTFSINRTNNVSPHSSHCAGNIGNELYRQRHEDKTQQLQPRKGVPHTVAAQEDVRRFYSCGTYTSPDICYQREPFRSIISRCSS